MGDPGNASKVDSYRNFVDLFASPAEETPADKKHPAEDECKKPPPGEWAGIQARSGGEQTPDEIRKLNKVLFGAFQCQSYYVAVEKTWDTYSFIFRHHGDLPHLKPVLLGHYDAETPPKLTEDFFILSPKNEGLERIRVIPTDARKNFAGRHQLLENLLSRDVFSLAKGRLVRGFRLDRARDDAELYSLTIALNDAPFEPAEFTRESPRTSDPVDYIQRVIDRKVKAAPDKRQEIMLVVDASASMDDDTKAVRDKLEEVVFGLRQSKKGGVLGLVGFANEDIRLLVSLKEGESLEKNIKKVQNGLTVVAEEMSGYKEYIYDALSVALGDIARAGKEGSARTVFLLTDEEGEIGKRGETRESIEKKAGALNVDIRFIRLGTKITLNYEDYLKEENIHPDHLASGERVKLWDEMMNDEILSPSGKRTLIRNLMEENNPDKTLPLFISALNDPNPSVRGEAAGSLVELGGRAVEPLLHAMDSSEVAVRESAERCLMLITERLPYDQRINVLLSFLKDWHPSLRKMAAQKLGIAGDPEIISHLKRLLDDPDQSVQRVAREAIEEINTRFDSSPGVTFEPNP